MHNGLGPRNIRFSKACIIRSSRLLDCLFNRTGTGIAVGYALLLAAMLLI